MMETGKVGEHDSPPGYTVGEVARILGVPAPASAADRPLRQFSIDTRTLAPGDLFVAVKGDRFDGRDFVAKALERGAAAALVGSPAPAGFSADAPLILVPDAPTALQDLARHHRSRFQVPMVAITGTNGKTTTKDVVASVLAAYRSVCWSPGNLNSQLGLPLTLLNRLRAHHQVAVFEVGMSAPGEIARLCRIVAPTHGVVTNIGAAHTQFLGSVENVFRAKSELVESLGPSGRLYVNAECTFNERMARGHTGPTRRVSVTDESADLRVALDSVDLLGVRGRLWWQRVRLARDFALPIPGAHMAYPGLFAIAVAFDLGLTEDQVLGALASCKPARHRMEVTARGGITIVDDCYNANPPSTGAALEFLANLRHHGRKVAVLGDMLELGDLGPAAHEQLATRSCGDPTIAVTCLVGPLYAAAVKASPDLGAAIHAGRLHLFADRGPLIDWLRTNLADGDLMLLKASRGIGLDAVINGL